MNKEKNLPRWTPSTHDVREGMVSGMLAPLQSPSIQQFDSKSGAPEKSAHVFSAKIPPNATDIESADSLIASQMTKLSVEDREKVYMDVHGISDYRIAETPELVLTSFQGMQQEIELLPDKRAYEMAEKLGREYVHDPTFRLAFLRADDFDCPKAALRIIRHFQMKLDLFGIEKLAMDITQDDLELDDMDALYSCQGRILDAFDSGGRIINLMLGLSKMYEAKAILRRAFYNGMVTIRNEHVQRHGIVTVVINTEKNTKYENPEVNWKLPKLNEGLPHRNPAIHICYSDEVWEKRCAVIKTAFKDSLKVRIRVHHGSVSKCLEELRGHGIDPSYIPVDEEGEATDLLKVRARLEEQRRHERLKCPPRNIIGVPFCEDVLLGKGTPFQQHAGNKTLRRIVEDRYKDYEKSFKGDKRIVAQEIVDAIHQRGGLFLKKDGNKWVPVENTVAIAKVSANFRTLRSKGGID